jgi:hypothetical protein
MATHKLLLELTAAEVMRQGGLTRDQLAPLAGCPYAEKGHAASGGSWLCVLAEGACPFQSRRPTTAGRHVCACLRPPVVSSPNRQASLHLRGVETVSPRTHLPELARRLLAGSRLFVIDEQGGVIGTVSGDDLLEAISGQDQEVEERETELVEAGAG